MPNRILKESICTSDTIEALAWFEEVLFYRLVVNCDDFGRFDGRTAVIKNRLFPLKEKLTLADVDRAVARLEGVGLLKRYIVQGKPYLLLPTWNEHQSVRAKRSKYPEPEGEENTCKQMHAEESKCPRNPIQSESNPNPSAGGAVGPFTPPSPEEVRAYCQQMGSTIDPQRFVDYYQANGWMQGKGRPIRDWKAMVRTWEGRETPKRTNGPTYHPPSQRELERGMQERERSRRVLERMKQEEQAQKAAAGGKEGMPI